MTSGSQVLLHLLTDHLQHVFVVEINVVADEDDCLERSYAFQLRHAFLVVQQVASENDDNATRFAGGVQERV